jgi:macrolide transport system ATP-binding/permease protein
VWFDNISRDVQFAFRQFANRPGFACTVIAVLALGIGVSVAIFGFVYASLVRPLPYAKPQQLMSVNENSVDAPRWPLSYPDFLDWSTLNKSFASLDVYSGRGYLLRTPSGPELVQAERVSAGFFQTLGVPVLLGRSFSPAEDRLGGPNLAILSYGTWLHRFSGRPDVLGKTIELNDDPYTVIGVLPRTFSLVPLAMPSSGFPLTDSRPTRTFETFTTFWG